MSEKQGGDHPARRRDAYVVREAVRVSAEIQVLGEQLERLSSVLEKAGLSLSEWKTYLRHAGEPALWELDKNNTQ